MKIGVFSDPHYCHAECLCNSRLCSLSLDKMREALDAFEKEKIDLCVCLGDIIDFHQDADGSRELFRDVMKVLKGRPFPFAYVPGNHDYVCLSAEEISSLLEVPTPPYTFELCGFRFIGLDGNYDSNMVRYGTVPFDWIDSNLPHEQVEYLKRELGSSELPCIVMIHEPLDPGTDSNHCINNAAEVREIIERSGRVPLVLQGHFHRGADNVIGGIRYYTSDAMCEGEKNHYTVIEV